MTVSLGRNTLANGIGSQIPERGSLELLTFDPDFVADLLPGLRLTVFYFLGNGCNDSLFHRHCSEVWLIETHFRKRNG